MNDYSFGNFVCSLREKQGLTQADLARELGVTPAAISKWENGSSKPRVEILFQLAKILGVRPEELMAGRYIEEHLDTESVRLLNEKYEHLRRIELHNTSKTKIFRFVAALMDWNIIGFATLFAVLLVDSPGTSSASAPQILLMLLLMFAYPVCFVLRDLIFGGRSLGKRIMGLTVLDMQTGEAPKKSALLVRDLFIFIIEAEAVIMLITGRTLGDRAAHTVVVRKKDLDLKNADPREESTERINRYADDQKKSAALKKRRTVMWICIVAAAFTVFIAAILLIINSVMDKTKETEEYKMAYSYLVESREFDELELREDMIRFNSYSKNSYKEGGEIVRSDVEITFGIGFFRERTVILHNEGDGWYVCEECTKFD